MALPQAIGAIKFWVVWSPSAGTPTVVHESKDKAEAEARRLALNTPKVNGPVDFYVMESVSVSRRPETIVTTPIVGPSPSGSEPEWLQRNRAAAGSDF